jgi:hypothetical protein
MRLVMAKPAASSLALLIRRPVDRRSIETANLLFTLLSEPWAARALVLVLITDMMFLLKSASLRVWLRTQEIVLLMADDSSVLSLTLEKTEKYLKLG